MSKQITTCDKFLRFFKRVGTGLLVIYCVCIYAVGFTTIVGLVVGVDSNSDWAGAFFFSLMGHIILTGIGLLLHEAWAGN